ncbi:MAG: matrixin family metalloprotease [Solirubrobacteraceae bacterium]
MLGDRTSNRARRLRSLTGALVLAASLLAATGSVAAGGTHAANDGGTGAAVNSSTVFPVDSAAMIRAEAIAVVYWNTTPCGGVVTVRWASLDPSINATSNWWNPVAAYGNAGANRQCSITLNQDQNFDWPMFCTVMVHEIGHLTGHPHVADPNSVMNPDYTDSISQCLGTATGAPTSTRKSTAASATAVPGTHKAHSKKKHHKKKKAAKKA